MMHTQVARHVMHCHLQICADACVLDVGRNSMLRASWNSWRSVVVERVLTREKVAWSLSRMMHAQLAACWAQWTEATLDGHQERQVCSAPNNAPLLERCELHWTNSNSENSFQRVHSSLRASCMLLCNSPFSEGSVIDMAYTKTGKASFIIRCPSFLPAGADHDSAPA